MGLIAVENIPNEKWTFINSEAFCRWFGKDDKVEITNTDKIWKVKIGEQPNAKDRLNWRERIGGSIGEEFIPIEMKGANKSTSLCISDVSNNPKSKTKNFVWVPEVSLYPVNRSAFPVDLEVQRLRLMAHLVPTLEQRAELQAEEVEQNRPYDSQPNELGNQFVSNIQTLVQDITRFLNPQTIIDRAARIQDQKWRKDFEQKNFRYKILQVKSAVEILSRTKLDMSQYDGKEKGSFMKRMESASQGSLEDALILCNIILENMPFEPTLYTQRRVAPWMK